MKTLFMGIGLFLGVFLLSFNHCFATEINVAGGGASFDNVLKPIKEPFEKASGIKLNIIASGPKVALLDMDRKSRDALLVGLTIQELEALMKKEAVVLSSNAKLQYVEVGSYDIALLIHKDNPVGQLNKEQLKGIFTGKITNWKEVGGKDMPIIVVWGKLTPGINNNFIKSVMDNQNLLKDVLEVATSSDVKQAVASNPEAIGLGPLGVVDNSVKSQIIPEMKRPFIMVTLGEPKEEVTKLIDFIKGEGQKYIRK
ncbi:MAG: substrate-binding domain-containing protein [Thermodesulfovibrionales bacterium]|nr:substrate-binding domain-containing protein [Thermodesulfovibrionales bacterium]